MPLIGTGFDSPKKKTLWKENTALVILGVHLLISPGWHHYFAFFPFLWLILEEGGKYG